MNKAVADYVTDSLRLVGQLWTPGSRQSSEALAEVTRYFNQLLDSWNTMRNAIYSMADLTFGLTSGKFSYTIGSGGDLNGPRPQAIEAANLIYQTAPTVERLPIEIINVDQWSSIRLPQLQSAIPLKLYYDNGYSQTNPFGLGTINLWPAPQANYQLELFLWTTLPTTLLPTDTLFVPPGYARALTYNLAMEIMPLYRKRLDRDVVADIMRIADESRAYVNALNAPMPIVAIDPALLPTNTSGFNWLVSVN